MEIRKAPDTLLNTYPNLGHYQLQEKIAQGGMGVVYAATDTRLLRKVAIKVLAPEWITSEKSRQRFMQEAITTSALNHPNICTIYDVGTEGDISYIAMEFVDGQTLREVIKTEGPLPEPEVIRILNAIIDALSTAHAKGIVHRDIKPDNIMLTCDGQVKVMDFGLAKLLEQNDAPENDTAASLSGIDLDRYPSLKTSFSTFQGTLPYLSPEQLQKKPIDARVDLYALGVTAYELLTGKLPYDYSSEDDLINSILEVTIKRPRDINPAVSEELEKIILKTLAKNPSERYATINALQKAISDLQQRRRKKTLLIRLGAGVIVSFLLAGIIYALATYESPREKALKHLHKFARTVPVPISTTTEIAQWPSFFPDGDRFSHETAFNARNMWRGIIIKSLKDTMTTFFEGYPYFNPLFSSMNQNSILAASRLEGVIALIDGHSRDWEKISPFGSTPRWSPDGQCLAFSREHPYFPGKKNEILIFNPHDSSIKKISPENELNYSWPEWSPDQSKIICTGGKGSQFGVWMIEFPDLKAYPFGPQTDWMSCPRWRRTPSILYFLSKKSGESNIWGVPVHPESGAWLDAPVQITRDDFIQSFDVSPDGQKILFDQNRIEQRLWQIPKSDFHEFQIRNNHLIADNLIHCENLTLSPDGAIAVLETREQGKRLLKVIPVQERVTERILFDKMPAFAPDFSADGQWVAFDAGGGNNADIWRVSINGGEAEKIIDHPGADWLPTFSPTENKLCFLSNRSGSYDLWLYDFATDSSIQLTRTPTLESRGCWSPDGQKLAFLEDCEPVAQSELKILDLPTGRIRTVARINCRVKNEHKFLWTSDMKSLYFVQEVYHFIHINLVTGELNYLLNATTQKSTQFGIIGEIASMAIFNDDLFVVSGHARSRIYLLEPGPEN